MSALLTQSLCDTVQTGTGKFDPSRKFKCTRAHLLLFRNQNQLLSASCAIQTYAIKLIYYQLSCDHIHLLSSLTCYQANLLSILSCNQQFCYQSSFTIKFSTCCRSLILTIFFPTNLLKDSNNSTCIFTKKT